MSDYILKFWPKEDVKEVKTEKIKQGLITSKILGEPSEYWNKPAYKAGEFLNDYLKPKLESSDPFFEEIHILVADQDYGVETGEEDFEYIDRYNVISLLGGDGTIEAWDGMCKRLQEITGDEYVGDWELL